MKKPAALVLVFLCALSAAIACDVDHAPDGLRATPPGDGPVVKFDLTHQPLPELPLPNDVATFADPTSRTGRRVDVSVVAPTNIERNARADFDTMEGWGTSSPITVSFARDAATDPRDPAIDLADVAARMQGDEHDLSDDPIYVVDLTTGVPVFVDVGNGYYPVVLRDPWRYMPEDPKASESNLSFETVEEGAGLPQSLYRPALDTDFDGVLDHPNVYPPGAQRKSGEKGAIAGVDDLLTWYERETDTLILRPVLPLAEKTEYAVVLTDRLRGPDRQAVKSPFEAIYHPSQRSSVARLEAILSDPSKAPYFGDVAGTGLDHVAFAWTFTTQPTHEDMVLLRQGLYGQGPFARLGAQFPPVASIAEIAGTGPFGEEQPAGWQTSSDACKARAVRPYVLKLNDPDVSASLHQIFETAFGLDKGDEKALFAALESVDHLVVGSYQTPFLMGDPASRDPDTRFHVDFRTGAGDVTSDTVQFLIAVPKGPPKHAPFPVAFFGHGVTGHADEILFYAGEYAKQGIAMIGYNEPEHGLVLKPADLAVAEAELGQTCLVPFLGSLANGRAHDLDGDGVPDSGGFWWTSHVFHTRDNVRQGILDGMQLVRILRAYDGRAGAEDFDGDGKPDPAGDFDGDGVPDVGGPNVSYFATGESLGGIMSAIQGGIEPYFVASSPMSGGGSLAIDVGFRSYGVTEAVLGQIMGPVVFALPASERTSQTSATEMGSTCAPGDRSVRIVVNDGDDNHEVELACLNPAELDAEMTVVVTNVATGKARCARTGADGRFRVPIPTSTGDRLDIQVYNAPDVVASYEGCAVEDGAPLGRRVQTFERPALFFTPVANGATCDPADAPQGCTQFRDVLFPVGSPLVAPNEGLGLRRQSPELRRFRDLAQAAFDPADPINFAPYYMLAPQVDETGRTVPAHALLNVGTVGDGFVDISSGFAFGRAAGAIPFLPPSALARYPEYADYVTPQELYEALGRKTPMQFLIDHGVVEGIARLGRTSAGPTCAADYAPDAVTCDKPETLDASTCAHALYDADWVSEGGLPYDEPHPDVPLRLGRIAGLHATDSTSLAAAWEPRLRGVPFAPDDAAWNASAPVVGQLAHYLVPQGQHTWDVEDACRKWDYATYGDALTAHFFATEGRDVYYLSHPRTHGCLVAGTCDFER